MYGMPLGVHCVVSQCTRNAAIVSCSWSSAVARYTAAMGNSASLPEKVLLAVQRNDVYVFQTLVSEHRTADMDNPAARAHVLEHRDKYGRTPLLVAAAKNHYQILQQLISLGVDVHYINPARDSPGGALHEAAARRHEAAVELLLAAGANPFAGSASGRTALDEAVLSGHIGVVRTIEKYAEFTGAVSFKTRAMAGLSCKYKTRWVVLMPYFPFARVDGGTSAGGGSQAGAPPALKPRRCLWLYKDQGSVSPRCRLWVDGATVMTHGPAGTEGTLRLHTSHGEPVGDLATTFSHGYCISLRPADLTPAAAAVYHQLMSLLGALRPPQQPQVQQPATAAALATAASPLPQPLRHTPDAYPSPFPPPPAPQGMGYAVAQPLYPSSAAESMYGASGGGAPYEHAPSQSPPSQMTAPVPAPYPGAAGPCPMASPVSLHQHQQQEQRQYQQSYRRRPPGLGVCHQPPDPVSPHAAQQKQEEQQQLMRVSEGRRAAETMLSSGGEVFGENTIERMAALPGEPDEDFAARLASAITAASGQSLKHLYPQQAPRPVASPHTAAGLAPASSSMHENRLRPIPGTAPPSTAGTMPYGQNPLYVQSDPGGVNPFWDDRIPGGLPMCHLSPSSRQNQLEQLQRQTPTGPLDELDMDAINALIAAEAAAAPSTFDGGSHSGVTGAALQSPAPPLKQELPSAPPAPAREQQRPPTEPESETECIICLSAPKEVGFLHGDSVHRCVCRACSASVPVGSPCPVCRQAVERVIGVY
ncbi:hypothetical protein Agub_g4203 [Astrephomene gubernaculifera]|uniref:Uncharacterized protein n=1 Tax=Astrephomene gubernaculifera TaxID=47775 RepID=A0AAD3DLV2_9CHLO|nr:hypothetical protein Agub_g4203 [Astrephomene gubernaculifera]